MKITIRPETGADYARIAEINVHAFDYRMDEASIVALSRQSLGFDAELSLVAEQDGLVIGHALFSPLNIRLMNEDVAAVLLGPISVDTKFQRQGVGEQLMAEGHRIARSKGYALSFLLGHPDYYPRFGYLQHAFGASSVQVMPLQTGQSMELRSPQPADIPELARLWQHEENAVDFTILPTQSLTEWLSPNPQIKSTVYMVEGEIAGFTRIHDARPNEARIFLARDHQAAQAMAFHISQGLSKLTLPLHPYSASAAAFSAQPQAESWDAAMVLPLHSSLFDSYYEQIKAGERAPGRPLFPVAFDLS